MTQLKKYSPYLLALLITLLYFGLPLFANYLTSQPQFARFASRDVPRILEGIQQGLLYPVGKFIPNPWRGLLVFPYWLLIFLSIGWVYRKTQPVSKYLLWAGVGILVLLYLFPNGLLLLESSRPSVSHGSVRDGWIEGAKRLPYRGENFTTYSFPGYLFGRTYVHEKVRQTVLDAFALSAEKAPETTFVIGETGLPHGGIFHPHRTHRNGLSVDILTPLLRKGRPYQTHHLFNLWGYGLEFDNEGKLNENTAIDYQSLGVIILAFKEAAARNGLTIEKVIFDPVLRPPLFATEAGKEIRDLPYTKNRIILRHDDHFHIDFGIQ
jgi:penicillin-insensitive murein endopeptidase